MMEPHQVGYLAYSRYLSERLDIDNILYSLSRLSHSSFSAFARETITRSKTNSMHSTKPFAQDHTSELAVVRIQSVQRS